MMLHNKREHIPRLIAIELTRSCPLNCRHCRGASVGDDYSNEMDTCDVCSILDNVAEEYQPIIILTGGEPLMRADLVDIVRHSTGLGFRTVMATCGSGFTKERARELKDAGIARISLSIDGPDPQSHDSFRGTPGSFAAVLEAAGNARAVDLAFQVNTTVTLSNCGQLEAILALAVEIGAVAFHPFLLVPTGRGRELSEEVLNADEYEAILNSLYDLQLGAAIQFKPTCAPHYYRVYRQREEAEGREVTAETHGLNAMTRGCMGGTGFAFISHVGKVQICGFLDLEAGNLRDNSWNFREIWKTSELFTSLRDRKNYKGRCGKCEYWNFCGGCRARGHSMSGDYLNEEPCCSHYPSR